MAFDLATDEFFDYLGLTHDFKAIANSTTFVVDMNVGYKREVLEGDRIRFTTQLLDADAKRLHFFHHMYHAEDGYLAAVNEIMAVHISLETRRVAPMRDDLWRRVAAVRDAHAALPPPEGAGRVIAIKSK